MKIFHEQTFLKLFKSSRKNLHEQIFKRKNLQTIFQEKSPMNKSSLKFFKNSMENSPE